MANQQLTITSLPEEIWGEIFRFFIEMINDDIESRNELNRLMLVCKFFLQVIQQGEKLLLEYPVLHIIPKPSNLKMDELYTRQLFNSFQIPLTYLNIIISDSCELGKLTEMLNDGSMRSSKIIVLHGLCDLVKLQKQFFEKFKKFEWFGPFRQFVKQLGECEEAELSKRLEWLLDSLNPEWPEKLDELKWLDSLVGLKWLEPLEKLVKWFNKTGLLESVEQHDERLDEIDSFEQYAESTDQIEYLLEQLEQSDEIDPFGSLERLTEWPGQIEFFESLELFFEKLKFEWSEPLGQFVEQFRNIEWFTRLKKFVLEFEELKWLNDFNSSQQFKLFKEGGPFYTQNLENPDYFPMDLPDICSLNLGYLILSKCHLFTVLDLRCVISLKAFCATDVTYATNCGVRLPKRLMECNLNKYSSCCCLDQAEIIYDFEECEYVDVL
jgi:hypothetical protein